MPTSPSFKPAAATMFMHVTFHGQREEPFCSTPAVKKVDASKKRAFLPNVSGSSWGPGFGKQPSITERQSMSPSSMYSMVDRRTRKQQQMSLRSLRKQWNRPATELRSPLLAASPLSRSSSSIQMRLSKTMDSFGSTSGSHLPALSRKSSRARLILSLESATNPSRSRSTNMHGNGRGEDQDEARSRLPSVTSHHGNVAVTVREGGSGAAESYRVQTPTLPALHRKSGHKLTASDVDLAELLRRSTSSSKPSSPRDKERGSPNNGGRRVSIRIGSKDSNNSSGGLSACSRSSSSSASSGCSDVPPPPPGYFERVLVGSGGSQSTFRRRRAPHQSMMISAVKHHSMEKAVSVFQQLKSDTDHEMLRELVPQALRELGYRQVNTQWVEELANDIIGETSFLDLAEFGKLLDGYNSKRLQHLRSEFPKIVKNGQSMATYADVTDYLEADGIITVPGMILELLKEKHNGTDPDGVDMNDYIHLREVFMYRGGFTEVEAESMHALFNRYDDNGNGTMDLEELASAVRWLGFSLRGADTDGPNIEELTEGVWAGSNGFDFEDFLQVVQHHREKEILAARALFAKHATGKDHRGTSVDVEGGVQILFALGYITSTAALLQDACDERGLGVIERLDFNNFYMILTGLRRREGFKRSEFEDFRQAFAAHDVDDSGAVDVVELGGALRWLGYPVTVEVQQELMYDVDVDRSGEIDFDEFLKIMRWYKEAEFQGLERAFKQGDLDGNGTLDMKEVRHLLPALGYYLLTPDQEKVVRKHLRTGSINFRQCAAMIEDLRVVTRKAFIETCGFTDVDLKQLRELFSKYDHRSKGFIGPKELRTLLSEAFPEATQTRQGQEKVAELLSRVDADGDGTLVWQEFLHLMRQVQDREDWKWVLHEQEMASKAGFTPNEIRDLRRVFKICDSDASRTLNADEVIRMLLTLIPLDYVMREKVRSLIAEVDKDGNNVLSFTEFLLLMRQVEKANIYDLGLGDESKRPSKTADA